MKAIRVHQFGGPEVLRFEDLPDPEPAEGEVVVWVQAAGVNPVDTYLRSGSNPKLRLPYTPGLDAAGVIERVGAGVKGIAQGARVYVAGSLTGTYAEKVLCTASDVHPLEARLTFPQAAAVGIPYATAYRALFQRAAAIAGDTVLVHGASGGVGIAAVQFARSAGLVVLGTASTAAGLELVRQEGADEVFNRREGDYLEKVLAWSGGRGVDIILEMLANANLGKDLRLLARGGRVVVIGSRGDVEITPREIMTREADVRGMLLFNVPAPDLLRIHRAIGAGLANGTLRPVVGKEMPLREAAAAHRAVLEEGAYGKIVLVP